MHEFDVVKSLIDELLPKLQEQKVKRVTEIRFRRGSTFSEEALLQAFSALSRGTPLEGADVKVETVETRFKCQCGHEQTVTADDLIGHMFACLSVHNAVRHKKLTKPMTLSCLRLSLKFEGVDFASVAIASFGSHPSVAALSAFEGKQAVRQIGGHRQTLGKPKQSGCRLHRQFPATCS